MQQHLHPLGPGQQVVGAQPAVALRRPEPAQRQKPAQPPPAGPVARQHGQADAILEADQRCRDQPWRAAGLARDLARRDMGAHDPGDRVEIGDRQRRLAEAGGMDHQFLGVRGPGEEGEVRGGRKLDEHGNPGSDYHDIHVLFRARVPKRPPFDGSFAAARCSRAWTKARMAATSAVPARARPAATLTWRACGRISLG